MPKAYFLLFSFEGAILHKKAAKDKFFWARRKARSRSRRLRRGLGGRREVVAGGYVECRQRRTGRFGRAGSGGDGWVAHLFPSRTQKLSTHTPKVLGWRRPGRLGSCRFERTSALCGRSVYGGRGEVVNTLDCGSSTHGFDPHRSPHLQGYSSIGRVVVSKTIGCGFKSYCPCHEIKNPRCFRTARVVFLGEMKVGINNED